MGFNDVKLRSSDRGLTVQKREIVRTESRYFQFLLMPKHQTKLALPSSQPCVLGQMEQWP